MNVVNQLLSRAGGYWNPSTLSGAIDVLVVEQPDGSLVGSPFHARFGKRGVLRPRDNAVELFVNDEPVAGGLAAKLGPAGEVIFCCSEPSQPPPPPQPAGASGVAAKQDDDWVMIPASAALEMDQIDSGHLSEPETSSGGDGAGSGGSVSRWAVWRWGHLPKKSSAAPALSAASELSLSTRWTTAASSSSVASSNGSLQGGNTKDISIRLSSDQLQLMRLRPGANRLRYEVTTKYQGTASCLCEVHLWRHDDRLVVSDIDGTITRSDLLGQLLPMVGKDWIQPTVARLFSAVHGNGYRFLYLSSRGLGQSEATRRFLHRISQEGAALPEGPVLLSPASLLAALHREVIARRPQEFKVPCLRDIHALFPTSHSPGTGPFWAGFGNRTTDADTYAEVGISPERCFTVNSRGELIRGGGCRLDTCGPAASYQALMDIVDHVFPSWRSPDCNKEPKPQLMPEMATEPDAKDPDVEADDAEANTSVEGAAATKRRRRSSSTMQAVCLSEVHFFM